MADTKIDLGAMQRRVDELGARIAALRNQLRTGTDRERAQREQLAALEQRHHQLSEALGTARAADAPAGRHSLVHKLANDLDGAIANFTDWVDAEEHAVPPPRGFSP